VLRVVEVLCDGHEQRCEGAPRGGVGLLENVGPRRSEVGVHHGELLLGREPEPVRQRHVLLGLAQLRRLLVREEGVL